MIDEQFSSNDEAALMRVLVTRIRNRTLADVYNALHGKTVTLSALESVYGMDRGNLSNLAKTVRGDIKLV